MNVSLEALAEALAARHGVACHVLALDEGTRVTYVPKRPGEHIRSLTLVYDENGEWQFSDRRFGVSPVGAPPEEAGGESVSYRGLIFRAGVYEERPWPFCLFTEQDLTTAAATFSPVPMTLEHVGTVLDGKVGRLVSVQAEGDRLMGKIEVPKAFAQLLPSGEVPVSIEWAPDKSRIVGLSYVLNPRVRDAAIAAFTTNSGSSPDRPAAPETAKRTPMSFLDKLASKLGRKPTKEEAEVAAQAFAEAKTAGLDLDTAAQELRSAPTDTTTAQATTPGTNSTEFASQIKALEAQIAQFREQQIEAAAAAFSAALLADRVITPAESSGAAAAFATALRDDSYGQSSVTFGARVNGIKALYAARPKLGHFDPAKTYKVAGEDDATKFADRLKELAAMTPLGRKALSEVKN